MNFMRLKQAGYRSKRAYTEELIERSKETGFYVLHFTRHGVSLHGNGNEVSLSIKNAEILKLLFETDIGFTKEEILHNTSGLGEQTRKPNSVKTDISRLRSILRKELGVEEKLIQTVGGRGNQRYRWNSETEKHVLEL